MPLPIDTVLDGKFRIVQILGEGGMGTVYKVVQEGPPGTPPYYYAVKELLISPNTSEEDRKAAIDRFNKEIELLRGLKNPHIAALLFPFQERGRFYFVMEFVPGRSLEKMLEDNKGPLPEDQVIKWAMQVCEALSYIHSRTPPIILRDLKPGNIMITPEGEVQLIDFGIARRFDPNKRTNTENLGTISYASPEHLGSITAPGQKRSAQNPGQLVQTDARSDIYSLGATIYHLLTNYEPDPIQTPAPGSILAKNPRLRTIQVGNKIVCPIEQVIIKAMQQNPAQRFQNAEAMRMALQNCLPNNTNNTAATTIQIPTVSPNATIVVPLNPAAGLVCPKCGYRNRPGAKFCKRDGQPLMQGATAVPPQARLQAMPRTPISARPVQQTIQPRSVPPPPPPPIRARPIAVDHQRLGLQAMANKNYAEAVEQFKQALAAGVSYDGLYNLGRAYRQYGLSAKDTDKKLFTENLKYAAERLEEATRYKPDALDAYFQLGMCYRDLQLYSQAMAAFNKAHELAPQDPAIYYQLGMVALEQGYSRQAEAHFLEGLKINPDHTLLLIALGRLYIEMRQYKAAVSTLRKVVQQDPAQGEAWLELGRAHMKLNEWKLALSALEQALQLDPYIPQIYSAMAICYLKLNKKIEARQKVQEALQRDPNNAEAIRLQKQL
jgi:serine/threonine protein kinase/Flp pilus assembly protein TadD